MSWTIGGKILPYGPYDIKHKTVAEQKSIILPGTYAMLLVLGKKVRVLSLEGYIFRSGWTKDQVETEYIIPLDDMVATEVVVAAPGTRYDTTWVMAAFQTDEKKADVFTYVYKMELWKGSQHILIS